MLGLTKLISFGLTGLSTSGLSLYFVPKYFEDNSQPSKLIYKEGLSYAGTSTTSFVKNEESALQELKELHKKFQIVAKHIEDKQGKKHDSLLKIFQEVDSVEKRLQGLYVENKSYFDKLRDLGEKSFKKREEKLNVDVELRELQYLNDSMNQVGSIVKKWKQSIQTIICAIDDKSSGGDCNSSSPNSQSKTNPSGGAPTPLSKLLRV